MKFATFSTITIAASLLVLHGAAAPVDIETTELGNDDSSLLSEEISSEFGPLDDDADNDNTNIVTVNAGFFSYINSVFHDLMKDNSMDSSEINEFVNDWNSELQKDIVYSESDDDESSSAEDSSIASFEDKSIGEIDESIGG